METLRVVKKAASRAVKKAVQSAALTDLGWVERWVVLKVVQTGLPRVVALAVVTARLSVA